MAENTEAGSTVGDPVTADPKDGDVLTYTLTDVGGGTRRRLGLLRHRRGHWPDNDQGEGSALDAEGNDSVTTGTVENGDGTAYVVYTVVVRATDPAGVPQATTCITDTNR